jgi:hypothetical protein
MKTFLAILSFSVIAIGATCQSNTAKKAATTQKATTADTYKCPVCFATSTKAGDCPKDKVSFVKVGDYYCPDCYMTAKKPGKCQMCGVDMKLMQASK